jgi:hypothetical protein
MIFLASAPCSLSFLLLISPTIHDVLHIHAQTANYSQKKAPKSEEQLLKEWTEKYGEEGAKQIATTVKACEADYEYLKQFAIKVPAPTTN